MTTIVRAHERGLTKLSWLTSHHSFSFGGYYDPDNTGFGVLRVINDDIIAPGAGFGQHGHENMEIITIPLSGQLRHGDTLSTSSLLVPGQVQLMSAGGGIEHSEWNASAVEPLELFQIWIEPRIPGGMPQYQEIRYISAPETVLVSPDGGNGSLGIKQDAWITILNPQASAWEYRLRGVGTGAYVMCVRGGAHGVWGDILRRDALLCTNMSEISGLCEMGTQLLVIEVPLGV